MSKLFCITAREAQLLLQPPPSICPIKTDPESIKLREKWQEDWRVHDDVVDRLEGFVREA